MLYKYCVRDLGTGKYLNISDQWSANVFSWDVKFFDTKEAAEAAFAEGKKCDVTRLKRGS